LEKWIVKFYACLLILYGLSNTLYLSALFFFKDLGSPGLLSYFSQCETVALWTGISLFKTPANFIVGYGLLRCRPWGRYALFAGIATLPLQILTERLWWGNFRLNYSSLFLLFCVVGATLALFMRPATREMFAATKPFRIVGLAASAFVVLLSFVPLLSSASVRWMYGSFGNPPEMRQASLKNSSSLTEGMISVRLLGTSVPVYADSYIINYDRIGFSVNPWRFLFKGTGGVIEYANHSIYENAFDLFPSFKAGGFELEKFFLTNRWNPIVQILRSISRPQGKKYDAYEIKTDVGKGFLIIYDDRMVKGKRRIVANYSLYEPHGPRCISGMIIVMPDSTADALSAIAPILASIRFLEPEKAETAPVHYRQGIGYMNGGEKLKGQVELANAFYLTPERKEFKEAFEATLSKIFRGLPHTLDQLHPESATR